MGKWEMVRLGDVCTIVSGTTPKSSVSDYWNGTYNWVTPAELSADSEIIFDTQRKITEEGIRNSSLRSFPAGTVLLSSRAPIGKVAIAGREMYCNQGFKNFICSNSILNKYLFWFLKGKNNYLNSLGRGATFKEISKRIVEEIEIPLPPLETQQKIAATLDTAAAILKLRKQQLAELDLLVKSRFIEMFGDPYTNEKGWEIEKLGNLTTKITDGVHAKPNYTTTGKPFISVINITKGYVDFTNCKFVSAEDYSKMIKSTHPEKNDILYTKVGATYGIPAYIDTDEEFCLYVSVCLIKPNHEKIDSRFLAISLSMPYVKMQADRRIRGIGVPDLHLNQIREFDIVCPHPEMQSKFVSFVQQVDKLKLEMQKSLDEMNTLFNSLMQKYFE